MGKKSKSKTSRKGKREWRKNISTAEVDALVERQALIDRSGGALDELPSEQLFFVDTSKDTAKSARKVDKHRAKILHADSILERNALIPVLKEPGHSSKKRKDRDHAMPLGATTAKAKAVEAKKPKGASQQGLGLGFFDPWSGGVDTEKAKKKVGKAATVSAPAVEIDMPGCSYNPSFDDHQEALGAAVADEMKKVINRELQPEPVQLRVPGDALTEEDMFFLDVDREEEEGEEEEEEIGVGELKGKKFKKLTRADINRKARRRAVLKAEAERTKKQKLKMDIQQVKEIQDGIKEEDEEKEKRRIRRVVSREEKRAAGPPRLGRHKFKPEPKQVLLSSEVTGSLRKLKAYPVLIRDRFRSLQRRGIVETRVPVKRKEKKRWVEIQQGTRGDREREMHAASLAEKEALKQGLAVLPL
jgi:nucleolar protein 53